MPEPLPVISASRRTDLPRCFPEVLAAWLANGSARVSNPFNRRESEVDLRPSAVHSLVLWSKDYSALLSDAHGLLGRLREFAQVFFNFTITGLGNTSAEPGVLPAAEAARQFAPLAALSGNPERVLWRFDPIVFWREHGQQRSNLEWFARIAPQAAEAGVKRVAVSVCQWYAKARRRALARSWEWIEPSPDELNTAVQELQAQARAYGLTLQACSYPTLAAAGIPAGRCVDGELLARLHPQHLPAALGKDSGQRPACGCTPSKDIGSYHLSCPQGCVYCYANPK
jgi:hypothetical protein